MASRTRASLFQHLLQDKKLRRNIRLNDFSGIDEVLPQLGAHEADTAMCQFLLEHAKQGREAYIKTNDVIDHIVVAYPGFLDFFKAHLEHEMDKVLHAATADDASLAQRVSPETHLAFDLWSDVIRRRLVARVRYADEIWRPTIMCIEITQQCNAWCGHCASNSSPHTKIRLPITKVEEIIKQAAKEGVKYLGLTGGEPFLERPTLLRAIETATQNGIFFDYINSNCFWAKTPAISVGILEEIKAVAHPDHFKRKRGMFSFSVTTEHLRFVGLDRVINAILGHQTVFPGQTIELVSVRGSMFGKQQAPVFDEIIEMLGNYVVRVERSGDGSVSRIYTKGGDIDVFFNYIVPIGRGEDMEFDEYEHYELSDRELNRGLSTLKIDGNVAQTVTVGWDGKSAPDIVLKCSESIIAGNLHHESFAKLIANGNNDPLVRGVLCSVHRIIAISKRTGIFDQMRERLKFHSTIQGYVSEFMKDPKKRVLMSFDLLGEDIASGKEVFWDDGRPMRDFSEVVDEVSGDAGAAYLRALRTLISMYEFKFNFSKTTVSKLSGGQIELGRVER
jgi:hypothetical protein